MPVFPLPLRNAEAAYLGPQDAHFQCIDRLYFCENIFVESNIVKFSEGKLFKPIEKRNLIMKDVYLSFFPFGIELCCHTKVRIS